MLAFQGTNTNANKVKVQGRVAPKALYASVYAFVKGFLSGEEENAAGIAGDIVASFFVWGDLRDFFKELVKGILPGQKADWVVFGFAALGLATTLYPPADPLVAGTKMILKICRRLAEGKRLSEILVRQAITAIQRALSGDLTLINELTAFLQKAIGKPQLKDQIERIKRLAHLVRSHKSFASGTWLKIAKDITEEQLDRLIKTLDELALDKTLKNYLGCLCECLEKLSKEVKEELANVDDDLRKKLMEGMARAMGNGVSTQLMAKVLNHNLIAQYGRIKFLKNLAISAAGAENLKHLFETILEKGEKGKPFLFEFHTATLEAQRRGVIVNAFHKELEGRSGRRAEIDAILSDRTHIQASLDDWKNYPNRRAETVEKAIARWGSRLKVSKENNAQEVKFFFRKDAVHDQLKKYLLKKQKIIKVTIEEVEEDFWNK